MNGQSGSNHEGKDGAALIEKGIEVPLLAYLRTKLGCPAVEYLEAPTKLTGGFDTSIFRFSLRGAPEPFCGPLVIRCFAHSQAGVRAAFEAAVQRVAAELDYPAPPVYFTETQKCILGSEFLIMQHMPGHALGDELMAPDGRGPVRRLQAFLPQLSEKVSEVWTTMAAAQFRLHQLPIGPLERAIENAQISLRAITLEGCLDSLRLAGTQKVLTELGYVIDWLEANRPPQSRGAICHCDFHPFNVLVDNGRVSGVLDWANTMIGDPAMDLGFTIVAIAEAPVKIPRTFAPLVRFKLRAAARAYCRTYRRLADLDERAVRYYRVFACTSQLRWACEAILGGHRTGAFASREGVARLVEHIEAVTGIQPKIGRLANL